MAKASQLFNAAPFLRALIYGDSGTGKTSWGALAPQPLILLTEAQGLASIAATNPNAEVLLIEDYPRLCEVVGSIKRGAAAVNDDSQPCFRATVDGEAIEFQTLVLDSLSDVHDLMSKHYLDGIDERKSLKQWGLIQRDLRALLSDLRALPINLVCLALTTESVDDTERRRTLPDLFGSAKNRVGQYFSAVGYAHRRQGGHAIAWRIDSASYLTKPPPGSDGVLPRVTFTSLDEPSATLGSILLALYPEAPVAHAEGEKAEDVRFNPTNE